MGLVVVVVAAVVLAVTLTGSDSGDGPGSTTAGDTVKGYLEALARGDAEGALAFSDDQPGSKQFLTNDVLKKQLAKWPISNIRILSGDDDKGLGALGFAQVHVVATFGDKTSDATMSIKKTNGRWHMDATAIKLTSGQTSIPDASARTLTLFGSPIGDGTAYVFPGWLDVASSNPYLGVTSQPLLLDALSTYPHRLDTQIKLADKGTKAVHDAITAAFASCQSSHLLAPPPPCPVAVRSSEGLPDGSLNWGVADLSQLQDGYFDSNGMTMSFSGKVTIPITSAGRLGSVDAYVNGKADLTTSPPSLNFKD